jgi:uncharacterized RDD family membrane protein YckC/pSer/pThr/pTyr-binding forkhead associated (FHA) protein
MDEYKLILGEKEMSLSHGITKIGRAPSSDILLEDRRVSSNHAQIELFEGKLFLKDLNSRNGTYVNGRRIHDTVEVKSDDIIQIVTYKFNIKIPELKEKSSGTILDLSRPCPKCGERISRGYQFCPYCGASLDKKEVAVAASTGESRSDEHIDLAKKEVRSKRDTAAMKPSKLRSKEAETYEIEEREPMKLGKEDILKDKRPAGFWLRLVAYVLDAFFISLIAGAAIILQTWLILHFLQGMSIFDLLQGTSIQATTTYQYLVTINSILYTVISIIYILSGWARKGATWGKRIVGLKIYSSKGKTPIGWGRAILRLIGYFISSLILMIGFLMIGFTDRKRGLHDMIAGTYVFRER